MSEGAGQPRRTHVIRRDQVAAWLADSVVKQITTHWTSEANARRIRDVGVRIEETSIDPRWGQGFYSSTRTLYECGTSGVMVVIRLLAPFVVHDQFLAQEQIDEMLLRSGSEDARAALHAAGYDGVVVHWESGEVWIIAFANDQVKVIEVE